MRSIIFCLLVLYGIAASQNTCSQVYAATHLSNNFNETIAHAIHSITVPALRLYNSRATVNNVIPTVNQDLHNGAKVLPYAPDEPLGNDFFGFTMNMIDKILSNIGKSDDGLGPNWSSTERIVHKFHMWDLWTRLQPFVMKIAKTSPPSKVLCDCLLDTKNNGIFEAVSWVANHYETGTPITLLDRPIPALTDADSWKIWKADLLNYYDERAMMDGATFLYCATKDF